MIADDGENFVSRWSRRKEDARKTAEKPAETKPASEPAPAAPAVTNADAAASQGAPAPRELPPLESLKGLASEYTEFLKPGVDENLRSSSAIRTSRTSNGSRRTARISPRASPFRWRC
jgi:hypothetical protein